MKNYLIFLILFFGLAPLQSIAQESELSYNITGTIKENGDDLWDSNEFDKYTFEVLEGEFFHIELYTTIDATLFIMYGDFDDAKDIEDAMADLVEQGSSRRIVTSDVTSSGYATFKFTASKNYYENIVIFTYSPFNPSTMEYRLYSSIPAGHRSTSSSNITPIIDQKYYYYFVLILLTLKIIFYILEKYKFWKIKKYMRSDLHNFSEKNTHQIEFIRQHGPNKTRDSLPVFDKRSYTVDDTCSICSSKIAIHIYSSKKMLMNKILSRFTIAFSYILILIMTIIVSDPTTSISIGIAVNLLLTVIGGTILLIIFIFLSPIPFGKDIYGKMISKYKTHKINFIRRIEFE